MLSTMNTAVKLIAVVAYVCVIVCVSVVVQSKSQRSIILI